MYRVTIIERECPADDFDSENGIGIPESVEPYEVEVIECANSVIDSVLAENGIGQWDGGSTAYDPDGSHMAPDGTITERFGRIESC